MKETLSLLSDTTIKNLIDGLNGVIYELQDKLVDERFRNSLYTELLRISTLFDWEYLERQKKMEDTEC